MFHIAQINIARALAPLDSETMKTFVARLDEINALADAAPGFVWRLKSEQGPSSYLQPYEDERIVVNMSVWESIEALKQYVYRSAHAEVLRQRRDWFEHFTGAYMAMWWVPAGHIPGIDEAKKRLAHLEAHGPSQFAFTFKTVQPPDESFLASFDWTIFAPCPAT
jgi:heme-degrading monooxygenase HmoA